MNAAVLPSGIEVASVTDREIPGPQGPIPVRVYRPAGDAPKPVIVYYHGGGWVLGSLETHDGTCRRLADGADAVVVSVDYRMGPEDRFPGRGRRLLRRAAVGGGPRRRARRGPGAARGRRRQCRREPRGGDESARPRRRSGDPVPAPRLPGDGPRVHVGVDGGERGGLLPHPRRDALVLRPLPQRSVPRATILGSRRCAAEDLAGLPPAFVLTAEYDPLRDQGIAYADALRGCGQHRAR